MMFLLYVFNAALLFNKNSAIKLMSVWFVFNVYQLFKKCTIGEAIEIVWRIITISTKNQTVRECNWEMQRNIVEKWEHRNKFKFNILVNIAYAFSWNYLYPTQCLPIV